MAKILLIDDEPQLLEVMSRAEQALNQRHKTKQRRHIEKPPPKNPMSCSEPS